MPDSTTTLAELRAAVAAFVAERDWAQFHNAKDLAISISIEAAELLAEFQWHDAAQVAAASRDPEARERIRLELADILVYCLCLGNALEMDVSQAVQDKLAIAGRKYPAEAYHGRARKPGWQEERK
jgi:NTP pyrophosphatase (non-canonical NTP hydrolase)